MLTFERDNIQKVIVRKKAVSKQFDTAFFININEKCMLFHYYFARMDIAICGNETNDIETAVVDRELSF